MAPARPGRFLGLVSRVFSGRTGLCFRPDRKLDKAPLTAPSHIGYAFTFPGSGSCKYIILQLPTDIISHWIILYNINNSQNSIIIMITLQTGHTKTDAGDLTQRGWYTRQHSEHSSTSPEPWHSKQYQSWSPFTCTKSNYVKCFHL